MFDKNPTATKPNARGNKEESSALGFINIYLPYENGQGRRKLGYIPLMNNNVDETKMAEWLLNDPKGLKIAYVLSKMQLEFNSAVRAEGTGFALPEFDEPAPEPTPPAKPKK